MCGRRRVAAIVLLAAVGAAAPALGQSKPRICIVPVENGTATAADFGQAYRIVNRFIAFPGISRPIIYAFNRGGVWTIDESRAFMPYGGAFPIWRGSLSTKYAFEPPSKRIVAVHLHDVFLAGSDGVFREASAVDPTQKVVFHSAVYVPRLDRTFLATTHGLKVLDGEAVKPVAGAASSVKAFRIFDLPSSSGIVLFGQGYGIFLRGDDGAIERVYDLAASRRKTWGNTLLSGDILESVDEFRGPDTLLLRSWHETVLIEIDRTATTIRLKGAHSLQTYLCNRGSDGSRELLSTALNAYLVYGRTEDGACARDGARKGVRRLERLQGRSFVPVAGGEVEMAGGQPMHDLPTLGIVLMKTVRDAKSFENGGLFAFDGKRVMPIANSGHDEIGDFIMVYDARSLRKVLLLSNTGLFELTADRTIIRIAIPATFSFRRLPIIAEMPASRVALLIGEGGLFALDASGQVHPVKGSERYQYARAQLGKPPPLLPKGDEMLLIGRDRLFIAVDENLAADGVCQ